MNYESRNVSQKFWIWSKSSSRALVSIAVNFSSKSLPFLEACLNRLSFACKCLVHNCKDLGSANEMKCLNFPMLARLSVRPTTDHVKKHPSRHRPTPWKFRQTTCSVVASRADHTLELHNRFQIDPFPCPCRLPVWHRKHQTWRD